MTIIISPPFVRQEVLTFGVAAPALYDVVCVNVIAYVPLRPAQLALSATGLNVRDVFEIRQWVFCPPTTVPALGAGVGPVRDNLETFRAHQIGVPVYLNNHIHLIARRRRACYTNRLACCRLVDNQWRCRESNPGPEPSRRVMGALASAFCPSPSGNRLCQSLSPPVFLFQRDVIA